MLISEAFKSYAEDVIAFRNQSRKTEENHFVCCRALIVFCGDVPIENLNFQMIRLWKQALEQRRSPETVRNYIVRLRVVLAYLTLLKVPCVSPAQIPVPKRIDKVPVFLTKEQVAQCINATRRIKNKAVISLLYASGMRVSELCALDRGQIHDRSFTVIGKGGKARLCFIDERTETLLELYLQTRGDKLQALFLTDAGQRIKPKTIQDTFISVRYQTGLDVHPHTLRHSFATNLLQSNTNLYHVSKMLGHARLDTTSNYLHVIDNDLKGVYLNHHTT